MKRWSKNIRDAELKRNLESPDRLQAMRDKFDALPEVKEFIGVDTGFKAMQEAFKDPTGTSDIELTRRAIQAIEHGLAVRTDDQTAISESTSLPGAWKAQMLRALNGESGLDKDVREGLMRIAARKYNQAADKFNVRRQFYMEQAKNAGLDEKGITPYGEAVQTALDKLGLSGVVPPTPGQAPPPIKVFSPAPGVKIATQPDGTQKTYQSIGGKWVSLTSYLMTR